MKLILALAIGVFTSAAGHAQPLTLAQVLDSSAKTAPQIVEAMANEKQAEGRALSAEGAFDTVFNVDARSRVGGYYDGTTVETTAKRPFRNNGGGLYGGYRVSRGTFPVYEDRSYTNRLGELKFGAIFSLLRDRLTDTRRTKVALAGYDLQIAALEQEMVAIGVQAQAIAAYQAWVAAGFKLRAYRALLDFSTRRRSILSRQAQLGARAAITVVENDQNLVRRRGLVVRSEQEFAEAANALSFYYRDRDGKMLEPGEDQLPDALPPINPVSPIGPVQRPDTTAVLVKLDRSLAELALAENDLRPQLDLLGEVSKDVGPQGLGGASRTPAEAIVGVRLSVPLQRRAAKGRVVEARAKTDALLARQQVIRDQIATKIDAILVAVNASSSLVDLAAQEEALAQRMAAAERRRFEMGVSDFFLINQREEAATDARIRLLEARYRAAVANADLAATTADRSVLGLGNR